ncbi:DMT family transporter [Cohnella endophytica]|uniref:DMT family transporter n=1 Tax=Cohnella endophytica TaxID=2419778 RepID=UPI001314780E|nr:DMT family transporter [Cohnella endophytica]
MAPKYAVGLILTAALCYGTLATLTKLGLAHGLHVGQVNGVQFIVGAVLLWAAALRKRGLWQKPKLRAVLKLLAVGTLLGATSALYNASIERVPASIAVVMLFQFVWIGVAYEWIFGRIAPNGKTLLSIAISLVGALCAADVFRGQLADISSTGIWLGLGAAFSYAGSLYTSGKVAVEVNAWLRAPLMATGGLVLIMLLYPPGDLLAGASWTGFWPLAIILGLMGMFVPTLCLMFGTPSISAGLTTVTGSAQLPISVLLAWAVYAEPVSGLQGFGVVLILAGIAVAQWNGKLRDKRIPGVDSSD